jgi:transposase-like protein
MERSETIQKEGEEVLGSLPTLKYKAVVALLERPSVAEAAKAVDIHKATLYKWLAEDEEFRSAFRQAKRELFAATVSRLQQVAGEAIEVLRDVMNNKDQQGAARVGAARTALDYALKMNEQQEILGRLEALEAGAEEDD